MLPRKVSYTDDYVTRSSVKNIRPAKRSTFSNPLFHSRIYVPLTSPHSKIFYFILMADFVLPSSRQGTRNFINQFFIIELDCIVILLVTITKVKLYYSFQF